MARELQVGIIGVGRMGERHLSIYQRLPQVKVVGIADTDKARLEEVARKYSIPHCYTDYQQLLSLKDLDAVSICTPDDYHRAPAVAAAEAGKHILLEKPIATTLEDADAIVAAVRRSNIIMMVGYTARFIKAFQYVKELITAETLGRVFLVRALWYNSGDIENLSRVATRDSIITFLATHPIDLLRWYLGNVTRIYCEAETFVWTNVKGLPDTALISLKFENGAIGQVTCTWAAKGAPYKVKFEVEIFGTNGVAEVNTVNETVRVSSTKKGYELPLSYDPLEALQAEIVHFIECVRYNEKPLIGPEDARETLKVSLAAVESARLNKPVAL